MNEAFCFQICHSRCNLCGHVEQNGRTKLITTAVTQVVQQVALTHELSHNVERWLSCAHTFTQQQQQQHSRDVPNRQSTLFGRIRIFVKKANKTYIPVRLVFSRYYK